MRSVFYKRLTSLAVCFAVFAACIPFSLFITSASSTITDDFEKGLKWSQVGVSQSTVQPIAELNDGNKVFIPLDSGSTAKTNLCDTVIYTYNHWPDRLKMTSVKGTIRASAISASSGQQGLTIVYYYENADNWRGLCFTGTTGSQTIRFFGKENGNNNNFAYYGNYISGTLTSIKGLDTVFTITYADDGTASMILSNDTGISEPIPLLTSKSSFAGSSFTNSVTANTGMFALGNVNASNAEKDCFDDITISFEATAAEKAAAFRSRHAVILSKTVDTVAESDKAALDAALSAYETLDAEVKAYLEAEESLLTALGNTIYGSAFAAYTFTDNFEGELYWQQIGSASGANAVITPDKTFLPNASKNAADGLVSVHTHRYWPISRTLSKVTGKYKLANLYAAGSLLIYYYKDPNNWRGFYIQRAGAFNLFYIMKESDPNHASKVYYKKANASNLQLKWSEIPSGGSVVDFTVTYEANGKIYLQLSQDAKVSDKIALSNAFTPKVQDVMVSADGGKTFTASEVTHTFSALEDNTSVQFGMGHGQNNSTFDDITVLFNRTGEEVVDEFKANHASILSKSVNDLSENDKEALLAAFKALALLDADAKEKLANETKHLYALAYAVDAPCKTFVEKYAEYWSKSKADISYYDREPLSKALADYNALSDFAKDILADKKAVIDDLYSVSLGKFIPRAPDDYSDFTADFDNGILPFRNVNEQKQASVAEIAVDPTDPTGVNKAFKMNVTSDDDLLYAVCDELWNPQAQMRTITYRQYYEGIGAFTPPIFVYDYVDSENMKGIYFGYGGALMLRTWTDGIDNAKILKAAPFFTDWSKTDTPEGWVKFSYTFAGGKCTLVVELPNGTTEVVSLDCTAGARIALRMPSGYGWKGKNFYTDDVVVTMEKGDFDVNENVEDITVYYSENTTVYPDETALISGEKIGNNTSEVEIMRLEDKVPSDTDAAKYIKETAYDTNGVYSGLTQPVSASWSEPLSQSADILQATKNSIKIVIPKTYENGIYAVKITPKKASLKPAILYLNNPHIQFTMGDEGDTATRGGWLRIIGNNLLPAGDITNVRVQLKNKNGDIFNLPVSKYYADDSYSLQVEIPQDFEYGVYEVFVYNGWGDETAWSAPASIKIGASPRDSWPKKVFNVKDYGAKGNSDTNDTPAIVNALNAIAANGGGVLYFPKSSGAYRVVTTLAIPENTVVKGDGLGNSQIMWTANRWQYGKVPPMITVLGNVQITDIGIYASRSVENIALASGAVSHNMGACTKHNADNIYITNVTIRNMWDAGFVSQGGGANVAGTGEATIAEVRRLVLAESSGKPRINISYGGSKNLQLINVNMDSTDSSAAGVFVSHSYTLVQDSVFQDWSSFAAKEALIFENNDTSRGAVGADGSKLYFARNYMHDSMSNNRELFTIDGQPFAKNIAVQFVGQNAEIMGQGNTDDVTYKLVSNKFKANQLVGYDIVVGSGQGIGQVRTIVSNTADTFKVDAPFTISPNRNSRVWIILPRHGWIFVDNVWHEGAACGSSGSMVDIVFDGNLFDLHGGQKFALRDGPNWYMSMVNQVFKNPWYMHGEGIGYDSTFNTNSRIQIHAMNSFCSEQISGFTFRRNDFGEYYIYIDRAPYVNGIRDLILEKNTMYGVEYAINSNDTTATYFDGTLLRDNVFDTKNSAMYKGTIFETAGTVYNSLGYVRCLITQSNYNQSLLGDVNGDGNISLKDCTMVRFHVVGKITLTSEQLYRADVNADGAVTLKDANQIRKYILDGTPFSGTSSETSSAASSEASSSSSSSAISSAVSSEEPTSSSSSAASSSSSSGTLSSASSDLWYGGDW